MTMTAGLSNTLGIWFVIALRYLALILVAFLMIQRNTMTSIRHAVGRTSGNLWSYIAPRTTDNSTESSEVDLSLNKKRSKRREKTKQKQIKKQKSKKKHAFASVPGQMLEKPQQEGEEKSENNAYLRNSPTRSSVEWTTTASGADELADFTVIRSRAAAKAAKRRQHNLQTQSPDDVNIRRASSATRTWTVSELSEIKSISTPASTSFTERTLVEEILGFDSEPCDLPDMKLPKSDISHLLINIEDRALPANHSRGVSLDLQNTEKSENRQRSRSVGSQPLFLWPP